MALFVIAISAPFLASNRPIVLHGAFRGLYSDRFEEWKLGAHPDFMAALAAAPTQDATAAALLRQRLETVRRKLEFLASQIPSGQSQALQGYLVDYQDAAARATDPAALSAWREKLQKDFQAISERFDPAKVSLERKLTWPILDVLAPWDVFFLALAASLLLLPLLRIFLPSRWMKGRMRQTMLVALPAVLLAAYWFTRPAVFDTMDYKQDLFNGRIESGVALFPPFPYGINEGHLGEKYLPPSARYWMGTDGTGRDLMTRMIWGARISLSVGFVAVGIYVTIGIIVGTIAGYFRGFADMVLSRLIEIVICFPAFFLILAVLAFLQPGLLNIMIVIGLTGWTTEARLVRGEFFRLNNQEFVLAAKALGVSDRRIIFRHILPNGLAPVLVAASFGVASAILKIGRAHV